MKDGRLRIVSDGTYKGTHVYHGDDELLVNTACVTFVAGEPVEATIVVDLKDVDVEIDIANVTIHPDNVAQKTDAVCEGGRA